MTLSKTHNILLLRKQWNNICASNSNILPTQHYDYYRHLWVIFYTKYLTTRWRIVFHTVSEGTNQCIIPLVINHARKKIHGISFYGRLDYEDIIPSTPDLLFNSHCIHIILSKYKGYSIYINNIPESGYLYHILQHRMVFDRDCITIKLNNSYENYIYNLSKHQQQNIRTAYNKLFREDFKIQTKTFDSTSRIPQHLWNICQSMYERQRDINGCRVKTWIKRQKNAFSHILHHVDGYRIYILMHNMTPIAYMAGMVKHGCYYVPRFSHDINHNKYSPGIILICETIKLLIDEGIHTLDLMRGDEPYKLAMGGTIHKNYYLNCNVDDLLI